MVETVCALYSIGKLNNQVMGRTKKDTSLILRIFIKLAYYDMILNKSC